MFKIFSRNLAMLRKKAGASQEALAEKADVKFRTYSDIERGIGWPEYKNVRALAAALREYGVLVEESELFADPEHFVPRAEVEKLILLGEMFAALGSPTIKHDEVAALHSQLKLLRPDLFPALSQARKTSSDSE